MFTVALLAQKGGVGKTTFAVTLAVLAELDGHQAGILDADPSANATHWHKRRQRVQQKATPPLAVAADSATLRAAVKAARDDGLEWLFVDTAAGVAELPAVAAALADLILMPCVGTANNMEGLAPTARLVKRIGKPGFFVVNRGRNSKAINDACALALTSAYGLPAASAHILMRLPIGDAENDGLTILEVPPKKSEESIAKGQAEFRALWRWVVAQCNGGTDDKEVR